MILTPHREPLYNREKLVNPPIGKDSPWDKLRLSGSSQSRHLSGLTSLHIFRPSQGQPGLANLIITIE